MKNQIGIDGQIYDVVEPDILAKQQVIDNRRYKKPIELYGCGPAGATCKTCKHLTYHERTRRWYKCEEWVVSASEATDVRISWPACGKYEVSPP